MSGRRSLFNSTIHSSLAPERKPRMTLPKMVLLVFMGMLAGCGGKAEPTKSEPAKPGAAAEGTPPAATPKKEGPGEASPRSPEMPGPSLLQPNDDAQKLAERFITELRMVSDGAAPK